MIKSALVSLMLLCGMTANAQINLGNILGGLGGKTTSTSSSSSTQEGSSASESSSSQSSVGGLGNLVSGLTAIFSGEKQANKESIVGTWEYSEPAILFESDNFLAKTGAKVAAGKLEDMLQERLGQFGIKPGMMSITFNEDGTFTETLGTKTFSGTWTITDEKLNLTVGRMKTFSITTQLEKNTLMFVVNADKLLGFVKTMTGKSNNSNMKTISTLLKSINGAQAGVTLVKK